MSTRPTSESSNLLTTDRHLRLSVAQALTIGSVVLATIGTIAFAIGSYLQTQYIVNQLSNDQKELKLKVDNLEFKSKQIEDNEKIDFIQIKTLVQSYRDEILNRNSRFLDKSSQK